MKFEKLALGFPEQMIINSSSSSSSSTSGNSLIDVISFKRLKPLAPKHSEKKIPSLDNIPETRSRIHFPALQLQAGGTRWNPTQEQLRRLEALYQSGLRTPNANQIERITAELIKYGRIEGKNVFYWFQNHKARERQKQKRSALLALGCTSSLISFAPATKVETSKEQYDGSCKRQCRSWGSAGLDLETDGACSDGTLELFPLHPEWGK